MSWISFLIFHIVKSQVHIHNTTEMHMQQRQCKKIWHIKNMFRFYTTGETDRLMKTCLVFKKLQDDTFFKNHDIRTVKYCHHSHRVLYKHFKRCRSNMFTEQLCGHFLHAQRCCPTVRCCEVYGHSEIELCPGGRLSTSVSFETEMWGMCQHLQMGAHLQLFRLDWETHQRLTAVTYKAPGRGSAPPFKQCMLFKSINRAFKFKCWQPQLCVFHSCWRLSGHSEIELFY